MIYRPPLARGRNTSGIFQPITDTRATHTQDLESDPKPDAPCLPVIRIVDIYSNRSSNSSWIVHERFSVTSFVQPLKAPMSPGGDVYGRVVGGRLGGLALMCPPQPGILPLMSLQPSRSITVALTRAANADRSPWG